MHAEILQGEEKMTLKIRGKLVDVLLEIDYEKCKDFVIDNSNDTFVCNKMLNLLYGMLTASILH